MNSSSFSSAEDILDIYGPLPLPEPFNWPLYLAAVIGAVILAGLLFFYLKNRKKKEPPRIALHQAALADLQTARYYLETEQSLLYAERVSEILRHYIEQRFAIHSTRQTTVEFLQSIHKENRDNGESSTTPALLPHRDSLRLCLEQCDLAKYAHKPASIRQMEEIEVSIRNFIEKTLPEER
ncbi:MAG: DUF4381 family protein [Desulfopila sp.]|jgi:hypothetical protein|nr:DUF4381 family protein [Desulfopila sp.]